MRGCHRTKSVNHMSEKKKLEGLNNPVDSNIRLEGLRNFLSSLDIKYKTPNTLRLEQMAKKKNDVAMSRKKTNPPQRRSTRSQSNQSTTAVETEECGINEVVSNQSEKDLGSEPEAMVGIDTSPVEEATNEEESMETEEREIDFVPHKWIETIGCYKVMEMNTEFFSNHTGSWYDKTMWDKLPAAEHVFPTDQRASTYLITSKILECIPIDNILSIRTLKTVECNTDRGKAFLDSYARVIMQCFEHYFDLWDRPNFNYDVVKLLHKLQRSRLSSDKKEFANYYKILDVLDINGLQYIVEDLSSLFIDKSSASIEEVSEVLSPATAEEMLESLRSTHSYFAKLFDILSYYLQGHKEVFSNLPIIFRNNPILHQYFDYAHLPESEEMDFACMLAKLSCTVPKQKGFVKPGGLKTGKEGGATSQAPKDVARSSKPPTPPFMLDKLDNYIQGSQRSSATRGVSKNSTEIPYSPTRPNADSMATGDISYRVEQVHAKLEKHDAEFTMISHQMGLLIDRGKEQDQLIKMMTKVLQDQNELLLKLSSQKSYSQLAITTDLNRTLIQDKNSSKNPRAVEVSEDYFATKRSKITPPQVPGAVQREIVPAGATTQHSVADVSRALELCNKQFISESEVLELKNLSGIILSGANHGAEANLMEASFSNPSTRRRAKKILERVLEAFQERSSSH